MNDMFNRNRGLVFEENDKSYADRIASAAGKVLESAMDTSADREAIEELTAIEGFLLKLEIIKNDKDTSTQEKLDKISEAEDKLATDKERSAKLHAWMMAKKVGIALSFFAGVALLSASPGVQKAIKSLSELHAA